MLTSKKSSPIHLDISEAEIVITIRRFGPLPRTDLARKLGYSRANITSIIGCLLDRGILLETGQ